MLKKKKVYGNNETTLSETNKLWEHSGQITKCCVSPGDHHFYYWFFFITNTYQLLINSKTWYIFHVANVIWLARIITTLLHSEMALSKDRHALRGLIALIKLLDLKDSTILHYFVILIFFKAYFQTLLKCHVWDLKKKKLSSPTQFQNKRSLRGRSINLANAQFFFFLLVCLMQWSWMQAVIIFFFPTVGIDLVWEDHWASTAVFAQVEPIIPNKLSLPPCSLFCSSCLPHPLISLVWGCHLKWPVGSTVSPSFQTNKVVMGVYSKYKSHYARLS